MSVSTTSRHTALHDELAAPHACAIDAHVEAIALGPGGEDGVGAEHFARALEELANALPAITLRLPRS